MGSLGTIPFRGNPTTTSFVYWGKTPLGGGSVVEDNKALVVGLLTIVVLVILVLVIGDVFPR